MTQDSGERSEKATSQRMKEVHSKGKMSRSQDLAAWLGLGAAALMVPGVLERAREAGAVHFAALRPLAAHPDPRQRWRCLPSRWDPWLRQWARCSSWAWWL